MRSDNLQILDSEQKKLLQKKTTVKSIQQTFKTEF